MTGRAGKTRNIFLVWLIWPLITLGIYHFVWWYKINREARDFDDNIKVEPMLSLLAILIGWVIIVPPFVSIYRTGDRIGKMQQDAGMDVSCSGLLSRSSTSSGCSLRSPSNAAGTGDSTTTFPVWRSRWLA